MIDIIYIHHSSALLDVDGLPPEIAPLAANEEALAEGEGVSGADSLIGRPMDEVEKYYIQRALELTDGNREESARLLGIGERTLYRKIKEYDLRK